MSSIAVDKQIAFPKCYWGDIAMIRKDGIASGGPHSLPDRFSLRHRDASWPNRRCKRSHLQGFLDQEDPQTVTPPNN